MVAARPQCCSFYSKMHEATVFLQVSKVHDALDAGWKSNGIKATLVLQDAQAVEVLKKAPGVSRWPGLPPGL